MADKIPLFCSICLKTIRIIDSDLGESSRRSVCDNPVCKQKHKEEIEEQKRKLAEYNLNESIKEGKKSLQEIMEKGGKITANFESFEWLTEAEKEIYRQYNKRVENIENLEKEKENLLRCQECRQIPSNGKYYEVGGEGNYCKDCAKEKCNNNSSSTSSETNQPNTNQSTNEGENNSNGNDDSENDSPNHQAYLDCPFCEKRLYSEEETEKHHQDTDCSRQSKIMEPIGNKIEKNESILNIEVDKLEVALKMKKLLKIVQRIQKGEKVDIDKLDVSEEAKSMLKKVKVINKENTGHDYNDFRTNKDIQGFTPWYKKPLFIIGIAVILVVTLVIIIINARPKKRK